MRASASPLDELLQAAEQRQVLAPGQALVERGLLAGERDRLAHGPRLADDVVAGHERAAGGGGEERGEDADGGRLAGAVVAQQPEHGARLDAQVETAQRLGLPEALAQVLGEDRSLSYVVRHGTAYDRSTLYEMSRDVQPKPPIWARPEPRSRGLLARADRRDRAADRRRGGPGGGDDPADRARAAVGRDVALSLLRLARRAAGSDERHRRGRDARARAAGPLARRAARDRRPQPHGVPQAPMAADHLDRSPAGHPQPAAPHRAVGAVGRRARSSRATRRSC